MVPVKSVVGRFPLNVVALTVPITSSFSDGEVLLMPTLPVEVIRSLSVAFV